MVIHYSRTGYNGDLTYTSVCGKVVKTHQDKEKTNIHPETTTCEKCKGTPAHSADIKDLQGTPEGIKRRIYIESDILQADEFRYAQREAFDFAKEQGEKCVDRVFSQVLDAAWHDLEKTWEAVKNADEIYATSSLVPMGGGHGSPDIFNGMCTKAVKEGVKGKKVIILNSLENICWDYIDIKIMKKAFADNDLYMYDGEDFDKLVKIDISKIKK